MQLYSTKSPGSFVPLRRAVLDSFPKDKGLYMPREISRFSPEEISSLSSLSFSELSFRIAQRLIGDEIPSRILEEMVYRATNFAVPLVGLTERISILELFHGPSLAFKDFGARFMAELMSYFNRLENQKLTILVATSGDTGGAVAAGFLDVPGIEVIVLYPSGRVSHLQEKQLTALGGNIFACEIEGSFDDCQRLVKQAFLDDSLNGYRLSSANSINIARLIPQSFYYFHGYFRTQAENVVYSVPSGNFGNLTAGLIAKRLGLPIRRFLAATNKNDVVPAYLASGDYLPRESQTTISNAMDVGAPSNFDRMLDLYGSTWNDMRSDISGYSFSDDQTLDAVSRHYATSHYMLDPHGAVGVLAAESYLSQSTIENEHVIVLETAHPAKFSDIIEKAIGGPISIPNRLSILESAAKRALYLPNQYSEFHKFLLDREH